jgi:hypothetical protein
MPGKIQEKSTYFTFLSAQNEVPVQSALIDTGAVHTIIGKSTLDSMMKSLNIGKIENCQTRQVVHRFGTHGIPIEPEFGVITPWTADDTQGNAHSFNFRVILFCLAVQPSYDRMVEYDIFVYLRAKGSF